MSENFRNFLAVGLVVVFVGTIFSIIEGSYTGMAVRPPPTQNSLECFDTDGFDVFERGYVTNFEKGKKIYDSCSFDGVYLFEGYCEENRVATLLVNCTFYENHTCRLGACRLENLGP
ncbi:MAG: hypothetical protein ABH950_08250 [Candidatus Altiarchaeota archaeon]